MNVKTLKAQQSEATRAALVTTARQLFATKGFAATSTEDIVRTAGVTRGALYHHFRDKDDLFRAVCEQVDTEIMERIGRAAMATETVWDHLVAGCNEWLDACTEPEIQRIVLLDGPAVMGNEMPDIDPSLAATTQVSKALKHAMDDRIIDVQPIEPLARMLLGALKEGGLVVARAEDVKQARKEVGESLGRLLNGLRK